nr:unnamed protein product [Callosobruchus chinensis]
MRGDVPMDGIFDGSEHACTWTASTGSEAAEKGVSRLIDDGHLQFNKMVQTKCCCCNKTCEQHLLVTCSVCQKSFYHGCINLTSSETRLINSKKSVTWTCDECEKLGNDIISLKAAIVALQKDLKAISSVPHNTPAAKIEFEEVVQEVMERQNQKSNLMIFGLKEQEQSTMTGWMIEYRPRKLIRVGKFDSERTHPRPVKVTLGTNDLDLIFLSETWLSSNVFNAELFPAHYNIYRSDRKFSTINASKGGGVLLAVKNCLNFEVLDVSTTVSLTPNIDIVGGKLTFGSYLVYVFVVYIPPNTSTNDLEYFLDQLLLLNFLSNDHVIVVGDFNIPSFVVDETEPKLNILKNFMEVSDLEQYNNVRNTNDRLLDLILSNINCHVQRDSSPPLVKEDRHHPSLTLEFSVAAHIYDL